MKNFFAGPVVLALFALTTIPALAQYPARPIHLIVPFPAGGVVDTVGRILGQALSQELGQPVIVDNKPGAEGAIGASGVVKSPPDGYTLPEGAIGASGVVKSPPDGYTLLLGTASVILGVPALHRNPPYHPLTDFPPVTSLGRNTFFLFVHPSVPAKTLGELIAYARANPNKLSYGSGGTFQILLTAHLAEVADIKMVHVPYKGDPAAILDLLAGRIQVLLSVVTTTLAYAKEGRLRVLATLVRSSLAPDVPTMEEAGTPMSSIPPTWWGIFGPAKMPREIVARLSKELNQILRHPDVRAQLERQGLESQGSSPEEFATHLREQLDVWTRAVRESGLVQD